MKNIIFKYFTKDNTRRYIDVLPDLVNKYDSFFQRSIKMNLLEVDVRNKTQVWIKLDKGRLLPWVKS